MNGFLIHHVPTGKVWHGDPCDYSPTPYEIVNGQKDTMVLKTLDGKVFFGENILKDCVFTVYDEGA